MKNYKLFTIYFALLAILFLNFGNFSCNNAVSASESEYVRVEKEGVLFFSSSLLTENSELFVLPKGYYLKIISKADKTYYCEYAESASPYSKILGYVKIEDVIKREAVAPTYPSVFLTALSSSPIYSSPSKDGKVLLTVFSGQEIVFYGFSKDKNFLFCSFGVEFGYAPKANFESFDIPAHLEPLPTPSPSSTEVIAKPSPTENVDGQISRPLQVILIIFVAIPVIVITFLLFFSPKKDDRNFF